MAEESAAIQGRLKDVVLRNKSGRVLGTEIGKHLHQFFEDNVCTIADYPQSDAEGILLGQRYKHTMQLKFQY
ncbi:hypothetical protein BGX38DRAFT_1281426 [Terfezia claveryi]|nr:hypothetical protein BGX38DRAFT_1281426 [Terfezia claveryi]